MFILAFNIACSPVEKGEYDYGIPHPLLEFVLYDPQEGVHPNQSTLSNPNNPFASRAFNKWDIENTGYMPARFYGWATTLVSEPIGENQFYTAVALEALYRSGTYRDEQYHLWLMSTAAYQSVLDNFPDSLSYTSSLQPFALAPLAYDAIIGLGGTVEGWAKVVDDNGDTQLIPTTELIPVEPADTGEEP